MADLQTLINTISANLKRKQGDPFTEKVYSDEPILQTASHMANYTPPRIREMRKMANSYEAWRQSVAWLFYKQAKYMEEYTDDVAWQGEFLHYFPTYQAMNDRQLRGYFSWRTKVRQGHVEPTSLSFAFVYIYELLHQVGVPSAEAGFQALRNFWEAYRQYDAHIDRYVKTWLCDYAVYYGLAAALPGTLFGTELDDALCTVLDAASHSEAELFSALCALSSYDPQKGSLYKQHPKELEQVTCRVFSALSAYYEKHRKHTLCEKLFGHKIACPYNMFHAAVFYEASPHPDGEYKVNEIHRYICKNGAWHCEKYYGSRGKNQALGVILKTVDCLLRQSLYVSPMRLPDKATKLLTGVIEKEIQAFLAAQRAAAAPKIEIDLSKLGAIRATADRTRDKLITEEEAPEPPEPVMTAAPAAAPGPQENTYGLTAAEYRLLHSLLYGGTCNLPAGEHGAMPSLLADAINEKLFDRFYDTVIVFEDDKPVLLEDYKEELKGMIQP